MTSLSIQTQSTRKSDTHRTPVMLSTCWRQRQRLLNKREERSSDTKRLIVPSERRPNNRRTHCLETIETKLRKLEEQNRRSDTSGSKAPPVFWDQSLKSTSIPVTSRNMTSHGMTSRNMTSLPRLSRSAESVWEIPVRYPRGQQRPTTIVSAHQAFVLRHKQIVEASRRREFTWPQLLRHNPTPRGYYDITIPKARQKCEDWFRSWVEE